MTCKDCGLPLELKCMESGDHPGLCCDCFDEGWGMPATQRTRPRPPAAGLPERLISDGHCPRCHMRNRLHTINARDEWVCPNG